jgi:branched-subunit amino acid transport protein
MAAWEGWLVVALMAVGTLAIRLSVLGGMSNRTFAPWVERALTLVLPAMFAAIAAPMLLLADGGVDAKDDLPKIIAAVVTLVFAMRRGGYLVPLIIGMVTLHVTQRLLPLMM